MLSLTHVPSSSSGRQCCELPGASPWHRTSKMLLALSVIQLFTSIWVLLDFNRLFFGCYLAWAGAAFVFMLLRAKYGLLWFACGSCMYAIWMSVSCWRAVIARNYVEVCLDFGLASFESLVCFLALGRFHELGGLEPCCGPPDTRAWKGAMLVGEDTPTVAMRVAARRASAAVAAGEEDADEPERFLSAGLLPGAGGIPVGGSTHATTSTYIPPHPSHRALGRSPPSSPSGFFSEQPSDSDSDATSALSSVSGSYVATVGVGQVSWAGQPAPQPLTATGRVQSEMVFGSSVPSDNSAAGSLVTTSAMQAQQQQHRGGGHAFVPSGST